MHASFDIYVDGHLTYASASFNHALGALYRAQPFGVEPKHNVFDISAWLRGAGHGTVGNVEVVPHYAIDAWQAFEHAHRLRVADCVGDNDHRRDSGNTLKVPGIRISEYEAQKGAAYAAS